MAKVFKIPHHGSENADYPDLWTEMLCTDPIAILSPFKRGNIALPNQSDVFRISKRTNNVYITSIKPPKRIKKAKIIEQFVKGATRSIRQIPNNCGQVRLRIEHTKSPEDWQIELFNSAGPLSEFNA
jgi:hypothetical protein